MKESFSDLFRSLQRDGGDVTESDIGCLNYWVFMEPGRMTSSTERTRTYAWWKRWWRPVYNKTSGKPRDLVLFNFAWEHLCRWDRSFGADHLQLTIDWLQKGGSFTPRINRIHKQPQSHAMIVGVVGSGIFNHLSTSHFMVVIASTNCPYIITIQMIISINQAANAWPDWHLHTKFLFASA